MLNASYFDVVDRSGPSIILVACSVRHLFVETFEHPADVSVHQRQPAGRAKRLGRNVRYGRVSKGMCKRAPKRLRIYPG